VTELKASSGDVSERCRGRGEIGAKDAKNHLVSDSNHERASIDLHLSFL
jgi:hypothetical protein